MLTFTCTKCKQTKPQSEFYKNTKNKTGYHQYCKDCAKANSRKNHALRIQRNDVQYKTQKKNGYIKNRYGITLEQYNNKLLSQKTCGICGIHLELNDTNVHLDHCHTTNKLRDFLCGNCNRGIGSFHDSISKLRKAIMYLQKHGCSE